MNAAALTQHRRQGQAAPAVTLFPFLAVLICTMGALILLLVLLSRQAQLQARQTATAKAAEAQNDLATQREVSQWRIAQLQQSRTQTESQLADARLELGHIEDHSRRLRAELSRLEAGLAELDRFDQDGGRRREELQAELVGTRQQLALAEQQLVDARRAASRRRKSYAVVPYEGSSQTHRRPIYLECRKDVVILQPEGIEFPPRDFDGPMGPGNPLAAALRAAREYLLTRGDQDLSKAGEPYPLLLVRPEGIEAYYAARAAMQSWGSEFGYELVGDDWSLAFPKADPGLADVVRQAVGAARVRQEALARAAPRHYANRGQATYRVAPTRGGVILERGSPPETTSSAFSRRSPARRPSGLAAGSEDESASRPGSSGQSPPGSGEAVPAGAPGTKSSANPSGSSPSSSAGGSPASAPSPYVEARPEGLVAGQPERRQPGGARDPGTPLRPGEWQPHEVRPRPSSSDSRGGRSSEGFGKARGENWGLRDAGNGSVPITRPIRVDCYPDRLVLVPEQGASARTIPLGPRTEAAIDDFVSAVWQQMDSWGIAGKGMYWRPLLNVHVAPGAEPRFAELDSLLEGSGLAVQRK